MMKKLTAIRIGPRTLKTALAIVIAVGIVQAYGSGSPRSVIFAMLGAMGTMQPTTKASLDSCATRTLGVIFGALTGILLVYLQVPPLLATGIGTVAVITLYNTLHMKYSPIIPCIIVVVLCNTPGVEPFSYALGRLWDTIIGLGVGLVINTCIFPYNNRKQILTATHSLSRETLRFLEGLFDNGSHQTHIETLEKIVENLDKQVTIFSSQYFLFQRQQYQKAADIFQLYEDNSKRLVYHMEILSKIGTPGVLSDENRQRLADCGAEILDPRKPSVTPSDMDIITNFHVTQILDLRQTLMETAKKQRKKASDKID